MHGWVILSSEAGIRNGYNLSFIFLKILSWKNLIRTMLYYYSRKTSSRRSVGLSKSLQWREILFFLWLIRLIFLITQYLGSDPYILVKLQCMHKILITPSRDNELKSRYFGFWFHLSINHPCASGHLMSVTQWQDLQGKDKPLCLVFKIWS